MAHLICDHLPTCLGNTGCMARGSGGQFPDMLMSMVVGLATILALLKTQGVMMQFSYVSMGARNTKRLGKEFISGISYLRGKDKTRTPEGSGDNNGGNQTRNTQSGGKVKYPQGKRAYDSARSIMPSKTGTPKSESTSTTTKSRTDVRRAQSRPVKVAKILEQSIYKKK